jgi:hypothetical protein
MSVGRFRPSPYFFLAFALSSLLSLVLPFFGIRVGLVWLVEGSLTLLEQWSVGATETAPALGLVTVAAFEACAIAAGVAFWRAVARKEAEWISGSSVSGPKARAYIVVGYLLWPVVFVALTALVAFPLAAAVGGIEPLTWPPDKRRPELTLVALVLAVATTLPLGMIWGMRIGARRLRR